jgi:plastocyanin
MPAGECARGRGRAIAAAMLAPLFAALCPLGTSSCAGAGPAAGRPAYRPRAREITVTTVPLLVKESRHLYPFLDRDFAQGGVLEGKEVYAFSPSTLVVGEGDTIRFTFVNPEDDAHTFVLPDFALGLPGQRITRATYVAPRAGIYPIVCDVPSHAPMMSGQLVVLAGTALASAPGGPTEAPAAPDPGAPPR